MSGQLFCKPKNKTVLSAQYNLRYQHSDVNRRRTQLAECRRRWRDSSDAGGTFRTHFVHMAWDDSYSYTSCRGVQAAGRAESLWWTSKLGNNKVENSSIFVLRKWFKTWIRHFRRRSVRVKLLLNCYTVAASRPRRRPPSLVRYTNRPFERQRGYTRNAS